MTKYSVKVRMTASNGDLHVTSFPFESESPKSEVGPEFVRFLVDRRRLFTKTGVYYAIEHFIKIVPLDVTELKDE